MAAARTRRKPAGEPEIDAFTGQPKRPERTVEEIAKARAPQPVVEINTVLDREFITIDDKRYDLASWHDFGILKRQQLVHESAEFNRLWATPGLNSKQRARLEQLLDVLFKVAVRDLPVEVAGELDAANRESIVMAFTYAPVREMSRAALAQQENEARESSTTAS